jgi:branched-chain amino acid transport system substrate-binding protein
MVEALRRPGGAASADGLITALESLRDFNLGGFFVDFGPQKHTGSRFVDMTILTAEGKLRR